MASKFSYQEENAQRNRQKEKYELEGTENHQATALLIL